MDHVSQAKFYSRSLYDMCRYFVNQIPPEVGFTMEPDEFIASFRYRDEDGRLQHAPQWDEALPTELDKGTERGVRARQHRETSMRVWDQHRLRTAGLIPVRFMREPELQKALNPDIGACPRPSM